MPERRYDVDWLRIIAMLAVFLYHCTRFFDPEGWHLKNTEQSELLFVLMRGLIWTWVSWYVVRSKVQARRGLYLGADQAASHPPVYRGALCPAAAAILLRTVYQ